MQYLVRRFSRMLGYGLVVAALALVQPGAAASAITRPPAGAVIQLGTVGWMSTSSYGGNWAIPDSVSYYADSAGKLAIVNHGEDGLTIDTFEPSTLQHIGAQVRLARRLAGLGRVLRRGGRLFLRARRPRESH